MTKFKSLRIEVLIRWYLAISLILLFIPLFINFDSHHDGLILTTALELRKSIENDGAWPFNQYGQLWAFPFALISFVVGDQYLLIAMRLMTFFYYICSYVFIFKISSRYLNGFYIRIPPLLFLLAQPFALGLNSTFLPWPSALCTLLITVVLERLTSSQPSQAKTNLVSIFSGVLIAGIVGTRLQVGVLMLISIVLLLLLHGRFMQGIFILIGFLSALISFQMMMYSQGWLGDSLFDSIIFSSTYVLGDTSTYPLPKVTFLMSTLFLIILVLIQINIRKRFINIRITRFKLLSAIALLFLLIFGASNFSDMSLANWITLLIRRVWISAAISILIYAVFMRVVLPLRSRTLFKEINFRDNLLILISFCSFTQIAPLFDQMHFWWGFSPLVILIVYVFRIQFPADAGLHVFAKPLFVMVSTLLIILNILGVARQVSSTEDVLTSRIASWVLVKDTNDNRVSDFLNKNIDAGSTVLSLCPNSNALFSVKSVQSSSRIIVLWSPIFDFTRYKADFLAASYDYIVACPIINTTNETQMKLNSAITQVLKNSAPLKLNSFIDQNDRNWSIYKNAE